MARAVSIPECLRFGATRDVMFGLFSGPSDEKGSFAAAVSGGHVLLARGGEVRRHLSVMPSAMPVAACLAEVGGLVAMLLPGTSTGSGTGEGDAWDDVAEDLAAGMVRCAVLGADPLIPFAPLPRALLVPHAHATAAAPLPAPLTGQHALAAAVHTYASDQFVVTTAPHPCDGTGPAASARGLAWHVSSAGGAVLPSLHVARFHIGHDAFVRVRVATVHDALLAGGPALPSVLKALAAHMPCSEPGAAGERDERVYAADHVPQHVLGGALHLAVFAARTMLAHKRSAQPAPARPPLADITTASSDAVTGSPTFAGHPTGGLGSEAVVAATDVDKLLRFNAALLTRLTVSLL